MAKQTVFFCPKCDNPSSRTKTDLKRVDNDPEKGIEVLRTRHCKFCGYRFVTKEAFFSNVIESKPRKMRTASEATIDDLADKLANMPDGETQWGAPEPATPPVSFNVPREEE